MMTWNPKIMLGVGFLLMVLGVALPLLMVLGIIPIVDNTLTLIFEFFAFAIMFVGLILGMLGVMLFYIRSRKRNR